MVTLLLLRGTGDRGRRAIAVTGRNAVLARHRGYWWVLVSGFFEPLLYLGSIGVGVGHLVGTVTLAQGRAVPYAAFVAPAMLAWSAMNGTMSESTYQFYAKLREQRLFDAVLATPVTPFEVALGELVWSIVRGAVYAAVFLGIMVSFRIQDAGGVRDGSPQHGQHRAGRAHLAVGYLPAVEVGLAAQRVRRPSRRSPGRPCRVVTALSGK